MSTVIATTVLPDSTANDTLTFGATGDSVAISGDSLNLNSLQDAGGNNIFVSNGSGTVTSKNGAFGGALKLLSSQTFTNQSAIAFTSQLTSTYDIYCFKFFDINPATNAAHLEFSASDDGGSTYDARKVASSWTMYNSESGGSAPGYSYSPTYSMTNSTSYMKIAPSMSNVADHCGAGSLHLYAPSDTTHVKQWYSTIQFVGYSTPVYTEERFSGGFMHTTSAIVAMNFRMSTGNFDGTIKCYGISKT